MRPSVLLVSLFVLLMAVHFALVDALGRWLTILVQFGLTLVILIVALGLRARRGK